MSADQPLCARHPDDFHSPQDAAAIRRALDTCRTCKLVDTQTFDQCAKAALTAGTTHDGAVKACASGVVQAGIVCRADVNTWRRLSKVARPHTDPTQHCIVCARRFGVDATKGYNGMCTGCVQGLRVNGIPVVTAARPSPPEGCKACGSPMSPYAGPRPEGVARHGGYGYCKRCHRRRVRGGGDAA